MHTAAVSFALREHGPCNERKYVRDMNEIHAHTCATLRSYEGRSNTVSASKAAGEFIVLAIYWEKNRTHLESEKTFCSRSCLFERFILGIGFLIVHVDTEMEYVKWHLFAKRIVPAAPIHQMNKLSEKFSQTLSICSECD